jgi:hypothetical protein
VERYNEDLSVLMERITAHQPNSVVSTLEKVRARLLELKQRNMVKINHSVVELLTAWFLVVEGYDVTIEHPVAGDLVCDVYATKGDGKVIVEIETGYIPPDHALDPLTYSRARIASKISRYSSYANKFVLGTPPTNLLQIDDVFLKPPRLRKPEELSAIKRLCDRYYSAPPVQVEEIRNSRLHAVYVIDVDNVRVKQFDPDGYRDAVSSAP